MPRLNLSAVAAVQLATPPATALLAWPLLGEAPGDRLVAASLLVLGGIALTMRTAVPKAEVAPRQPDR